MNFARSSMIMSFMSIKRIVKDGVTHPFGDHRTVKQAFPAGIPSIDSDPFLMCDYFNMAEKEGPVSHPDDFPIDWHPHRGFDIASYLKTGSFGRHGDSLGNRETYAVPGMQWMSTGSGVVHAEGGATPKGETMQGFQIWINVPSDQKMKDPRYGTVPTNELPAVDVAPGVKATVLAGSAFGITGPFRTTQPVQMIDFELQQSRSVSLEIPENFDTAMVYVYEGKLSDVNEDTTFATIEPNSKLSAGHIILFDATSTDDRTLKLTASDVGGKAMLFAGKKLNQPIAWHGPIVMTTDTELQQTLRDIRSGTFPPVRVPWDYKRIGTKTTTN